MRFSLVNDTDYNVWFDDLEITHKENKDKINVTSWTDYYPYGKVAKTSCPANGAYRYGYQGEFAEKEEEWNSFELRQYDSEIGRFLSVDPMGEFWSSYVGMGNDPVNLTDPTGGCTDCPDNDPPAGWGQGYMIDEVVVTPQTSNIIANNQAFMQQMADFNSKYVPKPELPIRYSMGSPSTGAIEQSYPEEFFMPDIPILWVVGKFGKAAAKYGVKMAGFGGGDIIFGKGSNQIYHTFRHIVEEAGLAPDVVESAIRIDLLHKLPNMQKGTNNIDINVEGWDLKYTAHVFDNGDINIGRITVHGKND